MESDRERHTYASTTNSYPEYVVREASREAFTVRRKPVPVSTTAPVSTAPLHNEAILAPRGWPTSPGPIKSSLGSNAWDATVDIILFACSVAFLSFALIVNKYDQASTADHRVAADRLLEAAKYGPSVFPILFAAVLGRAAHAILLWRLEIGERIGILDLLAGSTSLTSTVTSQFKLRIVSIWALALVVIWALSPVGGQASFRQLGFSDKITVQSTSFNYFVPAGNMDLFGDSDRASWYAIVNALYVASLIAPAATKVSPLDTWGNVKVPMVEPYEQKSAMDSEGWFTVQNGTNETIYSSLVGVPMSSLDTTGFINYAMKMEAMYLHLNCPVFNATNWTVPRNAINATGNGAYLWWFDNTTARVTADPYGSDLKPFTFTRADFWPSGMSQCSVTTTYVEVQISCPTFSTCWIPKVRRSRLPHPQPAYTQLDGFFRGWEIFFGSFLDAIGGHPSSPTAAENYLVTPDNVTYLVFPLNPTAANYPGRISNDTFAIRLGQLMNAYWTCTQGLFSLPGSRPPEEGSHNTTQGTKSTKTEVIAANKAWVAILLIASIIMIVASLVGPAVRHLLTQGPDLMLNISSLATRNNPYIALSHNGTFLDARDRARLLKGARVRFGDVKKKNEVGVLAIGLMDRVDGVEGVIVERVKKTRIYKRNIKYTVAYHKA